VPHDRLCSMLPLSGKKCHVSFGLILWIPEESIRG
jgi:hypothetical protein